MTGSDTRPFLVAEPHTLTSVLSGASRWGEAPGGAQRGGVHPAKFLPPHQAVPGPREPLTGFLWTKQSSWLVKYCL